MVLDEVQILELIKKPSNPKIKDWKEQHNVLDIYLNGGDVATQLEKVKNFENEEQKKLRQKIARSTKDLMSYLLNPLHKVYSANGFNNEVQISNEASKEKFLDHLDKLPEGMSLRKWMQTYWMEAYISDPNGLILVESEDDEENPKSYPTYKSINTIHDYKLKWDEFEYIIFLHKEVEIDNSKYQVYRVYDHEKDALYYVKNDKLVEYGNIAGEGGFDEEHIWNHEKGYVPAVLISDIVDKKGGKKSFIEKIDEILKEYLRDSSVHSIYKFLHGFPIFWRYAMKCTTCEGSGRVKNYSYNPEEPESETNQPTKVCPTCNGKRLKVTSDVSDGVTLPLPQSSDDPKLAPDIAGYVTPDLETWETQVTEMLNMKKDMFYALWGTTITEEQGVEKTATEVYLNVQPIMDKLSTVSDTAEDKENKIVEYMAKAMIPDYFQTSTIKYGKRFLIETPDVLWDKYISAKEKKAPISTLDHLYEQYLMAEYHNDMAMMERKLKEFHLEPFVHYSLTDLKGIASPAQLQEKMLFGKWNSKVDYSRPIEELEKDFVEYVNKYKNEVSTESDQDPEGGEG
jgi:hypothetical protein